MTALFLANGFFHFTPHAWCDYSSKPFSMLFILPFKASSRPCEAFFFKSWVNTRLGHSCIVSDQKTQIKLTIEQNLLLFLLKAEASVVTH